jgi:hypothetical protein
MEERKGKGRRRRKEDRTGEERKGKLDIMVDEKGNENGSQKAKEGERDKGGADGWEGGCAG